MASPRPIGGWIDTGDPALPAVRAVGSPALRAPLCSHPVEQPTAGLHEEFYSRSPEAEALRSAKRPVRFGVFWGVEGAE